MLWAAVIVVMFCLNIILGKPLTTMRVAFYCRTLLLFMDVLLRLSTNASIFQYELSIEVPGYFLHIHQSTSCCHLDITCSRASLFKWQTPGKFMLCKAAGLMLNEWFSLMFFFSCSQCHCRFQISLICNICWSCSICWTSFQVMLFLFKDMGRLIVVHLSKLP